MESLAEVANDATVSVNVVIVVDAGSGSKATVGGDSRRQVQEEQPGRRVEGSGRTSVTEFRAKF